MKKIVLFIIVFMLILTSCSNSKKEDELIQETKKIAESYGLKDVEVKYNQGGIGEEQKLDNRFMIIKTSDMSDLWFSALDSYYRGDGTKKEKEEKHDFIYFMEEEIQNLSDNLSNTLIIDERRSYPFIISLDKGEVLSSKHGVWHRAVSQKFKVEKTKKPKKNSKEDWYEEYPDDDDWKDVVDAITELYGYDD